jgi:undecaprenyl-diphosphatase
VQIVGPVWRFLRRFETRVLLAFLLAALALYNFFELGGDMIEGDTVAFDRRVMLAMRNPADVSDPIGSHSIEEAVRDITALGGFTLVTLVTVVGLLLFLFHKKWLHAGVLAVTVLLAWASSEGSKLLYGRARPDLVPHGVYVYSGSFPSGHSTLAAATFLTLAALISSLEPHRRTKAVVYVLALAILAAVGASRVYLGVHWPSDVLAGWCLGGSWALGAWIALRVLVSRTR